MKPCANCPDPILDVDEAHWVHEEDCPIAGTLDDGCTCDLYVHPGCCRDPWCIDFEERMSPDPFPFGTETRTPVDEMLLGAPRALPEPDRAACLAGRLIWTAIVVGGLVVGGGLASVVIWWRSR